MRFTETPLADAYVIEPELAADERGTFGRSWCAAEFAEHGLSDALAQCNISTNRTRGTLRGLHYQADPYGEAKLVRCTRGAIFDVIVDLRAGSPSFGKWFAAELSADNHKMMFAPKGFAHGFQTLTGDTEVFYQMSEAYRPELARGIRFDDPAIGIDWPVENPIVGARDRALPLLGAAGAELKRAAGGAR